MRHLLKHINDGGANCDTIIDDAHIIIVIDTWISVNCFEINMVLDSTT